MQQSILIIFAILAIIAICYLFMSDDKQSSSRNIRNTPMHNNLYSVGRLMPQIKHFIQPIDGLAEGGRLFVKGPNIMMGFITQDSPGIINSPKTESLGDGWYDTKDIVKIDEDGYITIIYRHI